MKETISNLEEAVRSAKVRQAEAKAECSILEKDMDEFKNNKDGKINELKVSVLPAFLFPTSSKALVQAEISKLKTTLQKQSVKVKTEQKELQTANLELGMESCYAFV